MPTPIYAVDFGTRAALQIWGPDGLVEKRSLQLPRVVGGKRPCDEFILILDALMKLGDVVVESATVGASGAEVQDVKDIIKQYKTVFYTLSNRAVKNYRQDFNLPWMKGARYAKDGAPPPVTITLLEQQAVHVEDAEILYRIATQTPYRLRVWHVAVPAIRTYTSVRPSDKRRYEDDRSEEFMANMPPFEALPPDIAEVVGVKGEYSRSLVMPFAMALSEPWWRKGPWEKRRNRFLKVIGAYEDGYPSFYRRMTVDWMQEVAKKLAGVTRMEEVPRAVRKQAWKVTQRQLRTLYHLSVNTYET